MREGGDLDIPVRLVEPRQARERSSDPAAGFRVVVEFAFALGGFPGLGWLLSGRRLPGLVLVCVVPAFVWLLVPLGLSTPGIVVPGTYPVVIYLPALALVSSFLLAVAQRRAAAAPVR